MRCDGFRSLIFNVQGSCDMRAYVQHATPDVLMCAHLFLCMHFFAQTHDRHYSHHKPSTLQISKQLQSTGLMAHPLIQPSTYSISLAFIPHPAGSITCLSRSLAPAHYLSLCSAPEIIQHYHTGMGYGREVDMWSLGVILYIMYVLTHQYKCSDRCANVIPRPLHTRSSLHSHSMMSCVLWCRDTFRLLLLTIRAYPDRPG